MLDGLPSLCCQVSLGIIKACETRLFQMREMEEMVEFMKNEVPNWDASLLQVPPWGLGAHCRHPLGTLPVPLLSERI